MLGSSHLKPGSSGAVTVRVETGSGIGRIVRTVEVFTNDPERPKVVLTLKADI